MKKSKDKKTLADGEYKRLVDLYKAAGVDEIKLQIYDELIRKVAEVGSNQRIAVDNLRPEKPVYTAGNGGGSGAGQVYGAIHFGNSKT